ncbi:MAG: bifunctional biotin--[acetyl-CoA-carboxylase] synthetase/biotin operon repressor, partial [Clostridia bacterium]|nr:bifunctional biotin--[acetyl-CoA-carboxylase] synthetase/biotin operon repressor [Clostridia bacterium]
VILRSPGGEVEGIAQDISAEGALLVKEAGGRVVPFYAGDVTLIH